jgi:hypothetical protein
LNADLADQADLAGAEKFLSVFIRLIRQIRVQKSFAQLRFEWRWKR